MEQFDPLTDQVAKRLLHILQNDSLEKVELEAKLGFFREKQKKTKFQLYDVDSGLVTLRADSSPPYQFVTEIQEEHWKHLVQYVLNGRCQNFKNHRYEPRIEFLKTHTRDEFYAAGTEENKRFRVTRDPNTGDVLEVMCKEEIQVQNSFGQSTAHINVLNNDNTYDFRVSAKREVKYELSDIPGWDAGNPVTVAAPREKIRYTYCVGLWSIDLTELPQPPHMGQPKPSVFEVEAELRAEFVPMLKQAIDDLKNSRNRNFYKIIRSLVDTIRTLLTYVDPNVPPPLLCQDKPLPQAVVKKMKQFSDTSSTIVQLGGGLSGESRMWGNTTTITNNNNLKYKHMCITYTTASKPPDSDFVMQCVVCSSLLFCPCVHLLPSTWRNNWVLCHSARSGQFLAILRQSWYLLNINISPWVDRGACMMMMMIKQGVLKWCKNRAAQSLKGVDEVDSWRRVC